MVVARAAIEPIVARSTIEPVRTTTTLQLIAAGAAGEPIVACLAEQAVIAVTAVKVVGTALGGRGQSCAIAVEHIGPAPAQQAIVSAPAEQHIVVVTAVEQIVAVAAVQQIGAGFAVQGVGVVRRRIGTEENAGEPHIHGHAVIVNQRCHRPVAGDRSPGVKRPEEDVVAAAADQKVVTTATGQDVVAGAAEQDVGSAAAGEKILTAIAVLLVGARVADQNIVARATIEIITLLAAGLRDRADIERTATVQVVVTVAAQQAICAPRTEGAAAEELIIAVQARDDIVACCPCQAIGSGGAIEVRAVGGGCRRLVEQRDPESSGQEARGRVDDVYEAHPWRLRETERDHYGICALQIDRDVLLSVSVNRGRDPVVAATRAEAIRAEIDSALRIDVEHHIAIADEVPVRAATAFKPVRR